MTTTKHPAIAMSPVKSSQIHSIGYDPATQTMAIQFHGKNGPGSLYHYANVSPEKHAEFIKADSIGIHFGKTFKNNTKDHPFVKVS